MADATSLSAAAAARAQEALERLAAKPKVSMLVCGESRRHASSFESATGSLDSFAAPLADAWLLLSARFRRMRHCSRAAPQAWPRVSCYSRLTCSRRACSKRPIRPLRALVKGARLVCCARLAQSSAPKACRACGAALVRRWCGELMTLDRMASSELTHVLAATYLASPSTSTPSRSCGASSPRAQYRCCRCRRGRCCPNERARAAPWPSSRRWVTS